MTAKSYDLCPALERVRLNSEVRDDMTFMAGGQGGDGSLTVVALVSRALLRRGYHIYRTNNIASRIKGGHAAAFMRASSRPRSNLADEIDLLIAFDIEAVEKASEKLADNAVVILDKSRGALPQGLIPDNAMLASRSLQPHRGTGHATRPV